jgi:hypothetical protein
MNWFGWARIAGQWRQLTGPHRGLDAAGQALRRELRRRGLQVPGRDQCLTTGARPRDLGIVAG